MIGRTRPEASGYEQMFFIALQGNDNQQKVKRMS